MTYSVQIQPVGKQFETQGEDSLLDSALKSGIMLKHGCRDGKCGDCRTTLVSGQVAYPEGLELSVSDQEGSTVLTCQARAQSDLILESPEVTEFEGISIQKVIGRVMQKSVAAEDVVILTCMLAPGTEFKYLPGQYVDLTLANGVTRSYSMAKADAQDGNIELHIRLVSSGQATPFIFNELQPKNRVTLEGPYGSFYLRESERPIILLASGTGFAPIKALMEQMIATANQRSVHLFWGGRRQPDLYQNALCESWVASLPWFSYTPVLSDEAWNGRQGFVHRAVIEDYPDLSGHQVYACGAPIVIESAKRDFVKECGFDLQHFFADAFV